MDRPRRRAAALPKRIPQIKLLPAKVGMVPSAEIKTVKTAQRDVQTQFEDIRRVVLVDSADMEVEGND